MHTVKLDQWVSPEHLTDEAVDCYAARFAADAHQTLCLDGFFKPDRLAGLRAIFATDGAFRERYGLYPRDNEGGRQEVSAEEWYNAPPERRFDRELMLETTHTDARMNFGTLTLMLFYRLTRSPELLTYLSRITGQVLGRFEGGLIRIMRVSDLVAKHSDFVHGRCLCGIFYFNEGWQPAFGGRLVQYHRHHPQQFVDPLPNRFVMFRPHAQALHEVEPMTNEAADWQRWVITAWFAPPEV